MNPQHSNELGDRIVDKPHSDESDKRVTSILDSITDGIVGVGFDWRCKYANESAARLLRITKEKLVGEDVFRAFPEVKGTVFEKGFRQSLEERVTVSFEAFYEPLESWFECRCYPSPEGVSVLLTDTTERKRQEKERDGYREMVQNARSAIIRWKRDGTISFLNEFAQELFGYTAEEVIGKHVGILVPETESSGADLTSLINDVANHPELYVNNTNENVCRDGRRIWMTWTNKAIIDKIGQVDEILAIGSDVTKLKRTEEALRKSEERFRAFVTASSDVVYRMSPDWSEMRQLQSREFIPDTNNPSSTCLEKYIHPDDQQHVQDAVNEAIRTKSMFELEHRVLRVDGTLGWTFSRAVPMLDAKGEIVEWIGTAKDITERKRVESELRKSRDELERRVQERTAELQQTNERLREENQERIRTEQSLRLEEARLDALLHLGRISEASVEEITNFTLEQATRLTNSKIGFVGFLNENESIYTLHAVSKDVVKECNVTGDPLQWHVVDAGIWAEAIRERRTLFVNDYSKPHPRKRGLPPGHPYVERFMVVPILEGKKIVAVAGVGNKASDYDKSDERQIVLLLNGMWGYVQKKRSREELEKAYKELEKTNAELARYNRQLKALNQELQDFAFVASHDLNEPLRKIRAFGDMVTKRLADFKDATSKDYLKRMQTAAARMQSLLNSLLSYSRVTTKAIPMKKTDLRRSVKEALSNLEILRGEKNGDVEIGNLPSVKADPVQMAQLFQNLIGNALKFHRDGEAPHIKVHAKEVGDAYEIYVEDHGIGFDEKYLDKIFLPFQRLHGRSSNYEGVGMGLAICRKIVERHGGKITARSDLGKGSTFIVTLPVGRKSE
jgi:PAS domain S-box-containing protein